MNLFILGIACEREEMTINQDALEILLFGALGSERR